MTDIETLRRIAAIPELDRLEVLPLVREMLQLSEKSRREGLLSLEAAAADMDIFQGKAVRMMVDGYEPALINEVLLNLTVTDNSEGLELLSRTLIREAAVLIFQGANPSTLKEVLLSLCGSAAAAEFENSKTDIPLADELESWLSLEEGHDCLNAETALLETAVPALPPDRLGELVMAVTDGGKLALALKGASGKIIAYILRNISTSAALMLMEDIRGCGPVRTSDIVEAQQTVARECRRLTVGVRKPAARE